MNKEISLVKNLENLEPNHNAFKRNMVAQKVDKMSLNGGHKNVLDASSFANHSEIKKAEQS